jgi:hypothetical protein
MLLDRLRVTVQGRYFWDIGGFLMRSFDSMQWTWRSMFHNMIASVNVMDTFEILNKAWINFRHLARIIRAAGRSGWGNTQVETTRNRRECYFDDVGWIWGSESEQEARKTQTKKRGKRRLGLKKSRFRFEGKLPCLQTKRGVPKKVLDFKIGCRSTKWNLFWLQMLKIFCALRL